MKARFSELLPGDVEDNLEFLRDEGLELARRFRAERPMEMAPGFDSSSVALRVQQFFQRVREKDDLLTVARGTRILRHGAGIVFPIDNINLGSPLEASIAWLDRVVENIEHELDVIDRKRVLWMTVAAAVFSALAVVVGVIAVVISLFFHS